MRSHCTVEGPTMPRRRWERKSLKSHFCVSGSSVARVNGEVCLFWLCVIWREWQCALYSMMYLRAGNTFVFKYFEENYFQCAKANPFYISKSKIQIKTCVTLSYLNNLLTFQKWNSNAYMHTIIACSNRR